MMQENFAKALARILVYEGGKVNDPHDPGGKTNQGITARTYNAWLRSQGKTPMDVYNIPDASRDAIYKSEYWDRISGDELPTGLDLVVFDAAVNSGPAQATKWLQACLYGIQVDGVLGAKTLDAIAGCKGDGAIDDLIASVCSHRLATLQRLSTWPRYGVGWHARIANVQKTAEAWVDSAPEPFTPDLSTFGGQAKANVGGVKPPMISQITAHMTTGAAATATIATQTATQVQVVGDTFGWIKYAFGGLTLLSVVAGLVAMFSSKAHDAAVAGTATAVVNLDADNQAGMNVTKAAA
jgi:lysozyme family protein